MLETLKSIILDFHELELFTGTPRDLNIIPVKGKANVFIGVRRAGKSTFMFQIIKKLEEKGIRRENILYINFFDDRLHGINTENIGSVIEAYYSLFPEKKGKEVVYCFFDEIQVIDGWESFIDRILRTEKTEIYLTGSSAKLLSLEISTQMRGRSVSWEIFPFSFKEFLRFKGLELEVKLSTKKRLLTQKLFEEYWEKGGFPEILNVNKQLQIKIHQEYFNAILYRDIVERHNASHPKAIKDTAHFLLENISSRYSINRIFGYLKSLGHKISKTEVSRIIEWFEDSYFLFSIPLFTPSIRKSKVNPRKIYCVDHAFVKSVSSGILLNTGHLLENLVFVTLRRNGYEVYYYKTGSGKEIDFVTIVNGNKNLIQVCETIANQNTLNRELKALIEGMEELKIEKAFIITRDEKREINTNSGTIEVIPVWEFLLNPSKVLFCSTR